MTRLRRRALTVVAVLVFVACGCSRAQPMTTMHTPPKGQTPQRCATLTAAKGPGTIRFAQVPVATARRAYGHYPGVSDFLRSVGSASVVFCSLDNPASSLHGCKSGRTMFLLTTRGPSKLTLPCGAEPGIPR